MYDPEDAKILETLPPDVRSSARTLYRLYKRRAEAISLPVLLAVAITGACCSIDVRWGNSGTLLLPGLAVAVALGLTTRHMLKPGVDELTRVIAEEVEHAETIGLRDQLVNLVIEHPELWEFVATLYGW